MVHYGAVVPKPVSTVNKLKNSGVVAVPVALALVGAFAVFGSGGMEAITTGMKQFTPTGFTVNADNIFESTRFDKTGSDTGGQLNKFLGNKAYSNQKHLNKLWEGTAAEDIPDHTWIQEESWLMHGADAYEQNKESGLCEGMGHDCQKHLMDYNSETSWQCQDTVCELGIDTQIGRLISGVKILYTPDTITDASIEVLKPEGWMPVADLNVPVTSDFGPAKPGNATVQFVGNFARYWRIVGIKGVKGTPTIQDLFFYTEPTRSPTLSPTESPTQSPTQSPTLPTMSPTVSPTAHPSTSPTMAPSANPSTTPTMAPSANPSVSPTANPSTSPTMAPSANPTASPTKAPTIHPCNDGTHECDKVSGGGICVVEGNNDYKCVCAKAYYCVASCDGPGDAHKGHRCVLTAAPTAAPSVSPTASPSVSPTKSPSMSPTKSPSASPTMAPSAAPSASPTTQAPSVSPTQNPTALYTWMEQAIWISDDEEQCPGVNCPKNSMDADIDSYWECDQVASAPAKRTSALYTDSCKLHFKFSSELNITGIKVLAIDGSISDATFARESIVMHKDLYPVPSFEDIAGIDINTGGLGNNTINFVSVVGTDFALHDIHSPVGYTGRPGIRSLLFRVVNDVGLHTTY